MVITGGENFNKVIRFQRKDVDVQELPSLTTPRNSHGCGSYVNDNDKKA